MHLKLKQLIFSILFIALGFNSFASEANPEEKDGQFNIADIIFGHIGDAHDWHVFSMKGKNGSEDFHFTIPLPVILYSPTQGLSTFMSTKFEHGHAAYDGYELDKDNKVIATDGSKVYDFSLTKNVSAMLLGVLLMLIVFLKVSSIYKAKGATKAPSGLQNAIETVILFIRDEVAKPTLGKSYMKFMPFLLSLFFFIWIACLLGMIPGGANLTGNIAVTACLALFSFVVMIFTSKKDFWLHLINPTGMPFFVKVILVPIEIISLFIKPIALTIRLFANMLAGHIIILSFILLIFIFANLNVYVGSGFSIISVGLSIFSMLIEVLVTAIQAFIFTNLTAVFIGQMIEEHSHDAGEDGKDHAYSEEEVLI